MQKGDRCCRFDLLNDWGSIWPRITLRWSSTASFVSLFDYCNSLYCGLAGREKDKLQRVETGPHLRIGFRKKKNRPYITPVVKNLPWLTIIANVDVKIVNDSTPKYLSSLLASSASVRLPRLMDIAYFHIMHRISRTRHFIISNTMNLLTLLRNAWKLFFHSDLVYHCKPLIILLMETIWTLLEYIYLRSSR